MKNSNSKPVAVTQPNAAPTLTRTENRPVTDRLAVTQTFIIRAQNSDRARDIEEDSTDVFLLERCSPLNDF